MINRNINDLSANFKVKVIDFLAECKEKGLNVIPFETLRKIERQKELYAQGRTKPGNKVTWTLKSNHLTGNAVDIVFKDSKGNPTWNGDYDSLIEIAKKYGIRNLKPKETAHFEDDGTVYIPMKKSTNIKARPNYNFKNYPIMDQGSTGECAGYSILACLIRMKDGVDYEKIQKELIAEKGNELTIKSASEWYIKKGYIKGIRKASYSKSLMKRQPLITQLFNVNWNETNKPPYTLKFGDRELVGSHWVCISDGIIANSHGANKYDNGYCYFTEDNAGTKMKVFYTIIV